MKYQLLPHSVASKSFLLVDEVLVTSFEHVERPYFFDNDFIVPLAFCFLKIIKGSKTVKFDTHAGFKKASALTTLT